MKAKRTNIFVIVMIAITAAVVVYALFGHSTSVETARVILPTPAAGGDTHNPANGGSGITLAEVTPKTVQSVISRLSRAGSYYRMVTVEDFWDGGSGLTDLYVWVSGGNTRIRLSRGADIENILLRGGQLYIWYDRADGVYTAPADGSAAEADSWLRCLTYEALLDLPDTAITDAGYIEYGGESCIYAEYLSETYHYRNVVYVSVDTGLLMGAETYDADTLIYRMTSGSPDISAPDANMFTAPEQAVES